MVGRGCALASGVIPCSETGRGPRKRGIIRFVDGQHQSGLCDVILPGFARSYTFQASLGAVGKGRWSAPMDGQRRALDGVRVLDLTHQVAGPSAT